MHAVGQGFAVFLVPFLVAAFPAVAVSGNTMRAVAPERFADAGMGLDGERVVAELIRHVDALARRCVPSGQALSIDLVDLDRAGREPPGRGASAPRLMDAVSWPRVRIAWALSDSTGTVIDAGATTLSDIDYLTAASRLRAASDPLAYDKKLFDDWFEGRWGSCGQ
jgi:hypothetical protein